MTCGGRPSTLGSDTAIWALVTASRHTMAGRTTSVARALDWVCVASSSATGREDGGGSRGHQACGREGGLVQANVRGRGEALDHGCG